MGKGSRPVPVVTVAAARGACNAVDGRWPLVHPRSFERVFGPKTDDRLRMTTAGPPAGAVHRVRREPEAAPTVTVRACSPPPERTGQCGEPADGLLHRVPASSYSGRETGPGGRGGGRPES